MFEFISGSAREIAAKERRFAESVARDGDAKIRLVEHAVTGVYGWSGDPLCTEADRAAAAARLGDDVLEEHAPVFGPTNGQLAAMADELGPEEHMAAIGVDRGRAYIERGSGAAIVSVVEGARLYAPQKPALPPGAYAPDLRDPRALTEFVARDTASSLVYRHVRPVEEYSVALPLRLMCPYNDAFVTAVAEFYETAYASVPVSALSAPRVVYSDAPVSTRGEDDGRTLTRETGAQLAADIRVAFGVGVSDAVLANAYASAPGGPGAGAPVDMLAAISPRTYLGIQGYTGLPGATAWLGHARLYRALLHYVSVRSAAGGGAHIDGLCFPRGLYSPFLNRMSDGVVVLTADAAARKLRPCGELRAPDDPRTAGARRRAKSLLGAMPTYAPPRTVPAFGLEQLHAAAHSGALRVFFRHGLPGRGKWCPPPRADAVRVYSQDVTGFHSCNAAQSVELNAALFGAAIVMSGADIVCVQGLTSRRAVAALDAVVERLSDAGHAYTMHVGSGKRADARGRGRRSVHTAVLVRAGRAVFSGDTSLVTCAARDKHGGAPYNPSVVPRIVCATAHTVTVSSSGASLRVVNVDVPIEKQPVVMNAGDMFVRADVFVEAMATNGIARERAFFALRSAHVTAHKRGAGIHVYAGAFGCEARARPKQNPELWALLNACGARGHTDDCAPTGVLGGRWHNVFVSGADGAAGARRMWTGVVLSPFSRAHGVVCDTPVPAGADPADTSSLRAEELCARVSGPQDSAMLGDLAAGAHRIELDA